MALQKDQMISAHFCLYTPDFPIGIVQLIVWEIPLKESGLISSPEGASTLPCKSSVEP